MGQPSPSTTCSRNYMFSEVKDKYPREKSRLPLGLGAETLDRSVTCGNCHTLKEPTISIDQNTRVILIGQKLTQEWTLCAKKYTVDKIEIKS